MTGGGKPERQSLLAGCALLLLGLLAGAAEAGSAYGGDVEGDGHIAWDYWHPREALNPQELAALPGFCEGTYRWPELPYPVGIDDSSLSVNAESVEAQYLTSGEVTLRGDAVVRKGNRTLRASSLVIDRNTMIGRAEEGLLVEEEDLIFGAEQGEINFDTSAAQLDDAEFLFMERAIRGNAGRVRQLEDKTLVVDRVGFTSCEPGGRTWRITARKLTVEDDEIWGRARDAVLRVGNVPVLYTPFLRFPVTDDRQSGWLFPAVGFSDVDGLDLALPYYLNLAPDHDATIIPRYVQDRGLGIETEFRTLSRWQETTLNAAFLPDDDLYDGTFTRDDWDDLFNQGLVIGDFEPEDRWLYAMDHVGSIGRLRSVVDYTAVSDRDYFRDLGTNLKVASNRELERRGELLTSFGKLDLRFWAQRFDRLDEIQIDAYERVPELAATYLTGLPGPFELSVGASAARFDRDNDDLVGLSRVVGERFHVDPRLRLPFYRPWGFLSLTGGYRFTRYDLDDTEGLFDDEPERSIGFGIVDTGLFFERDLEVFNTPLVQTLEPRLYYLYQENEDQSELPRFDSSELTFRFDQLFRDNRFAGLDRIGDANQLSTGLTSRFLRPDTGKELLRMSLGTIVYFEDREVTLFGAPDKQDRDDTSQLAGEVFASLGPWSLAASVIYDPHANDAEEAGGFLQYRTDNDHVFNIGYRYREIEDLDQTDFSFIWPVSQRYSLIGRWNYDIESSRTIESLGGIEYNNCCWQVRVVGRRFIDSPSAALIDETEAEIGAFVQVVFKGLAGVGTRMESLLERSIRGYRPEG